MLLSKLYMQANLYVCPPFCLWKSAHVFQGPDNTPMRATTLSKRGLLETLSTTTLSIRGLLMTFRIMTLSIATLPLY
jgi:hypothetical protein